MKHAISWLRDRAVEAWLFWHYDLHRWAKRLGESLRR
jgi:hypothetical protein